MYCLICGIDLSSKIHKDATSENFYLGYLVFHLFTFFHQLAFLSPSLESLENPIGMCRACSVTVAFLFLISIGCAYLKVLELNLSNQLTVINNDSFLYVCTWAIEVIILLCEWFDFELFPRSLKLCQTNSLILLTGTLVLFSTNCSASFIYP